MKTVMMTTIKRIAIWQEFSFNDTKMCKHSWKRIALELTKVNDKMFLSLIVFIEQICSITKLEFKLKH